MNQAKEYDLTFTMQQIVQSIPKARHEEFLEMVDDAMNTLINRGLPVKVVEPLVLIWANMQIVLDDTEEPEPPEAEKQGSKPVALPKRLGRGEMSKGYEKLLKDHLGRLSMVTNGLAETVPVTLSEMEESMRFVRNYMARSESFPYDFERTYGRLKGIRHRRGIKPVRVYGEEGHMVWVYATKFFYTRDGKVVLETATMGPEIRMVDGVFLPEGVGLSAKEIMAAFESIHKGTHYPLQGHPLPVQGLTDPLPNYGG